MGGSIPDVLAVGVGAWLAYWFTNQSYIRPFDLEKKYKQYSDFYNSLGELRKKYSNFIHTVGSDMIAIEKGDMKQIDLRYLADHDTVLIGVKYSILKLNKIDKENFLNKFGDFKKIYNEYTTTIYNSLSGLLDKKNENDTEISKRLQHREKRSLSFKIIATLREADGEGYTAQYNLKKEKE